MADKLQAIIYIRVSTLRQAESGESLEAQEYRLRAHCAAHNMEVYQVIRDEGVSAKTPLGKRPGGKALLAVVGPVIKHVVVMKFDRMFRNTLDALTTIEEFTKRGVTLHALDFGGMSLDTGSAIGQLFITIRAGFAQMERELGRERTIEAMKNKRRKGECIGAVPFGFSKDDLGMLVEDPRRAKVLASMVAMQKRGTPLRAIADNVSSDYGTPFVTSHQTVKRILDNLNNQEISA